MFNAKPAQYSRNKLQSYQKSQIMSMDPVPLLIKVYDYTIMQCKKGDPVKAGKGLVELMSALNFDHDEVSLGLFRLYQYCQDQIRAGNFDEAVEILERLRKSWIESQKREMKETPS